MRYKASISASSKLPPIIRTTLEERSTYHQQFFYTFLIATFVLLLLPVFVIWDLRSEKPSLQLFVSLIWLILQGICGYLIFHHRKRKRVLDDCLHHEGFSIIKGTLKEIQRLRLKRVRFIIDEHTIDGELVFPGFTAFLNTKVVDVVAAYGQIVELYLLPGSLIAGTLYPKLPSRLTDRPITPEDRQLVVQRQWRKVKWFGVSSLFFSLLLVGIAWLTERQIGVGWDSLGFMLVAFNGINLLFLGVQTALSWHEVRALMDKHDHSMLVQVYHGVAAEWYLTGTRYNGKTYGPQEFDGWIRLSGGLHRIQDNLSLTERGVLDPLWTAIQVEYLVHRGRQIFLRSTTKAHLPRL